DFLGDETLERRLELRAQRLLVDEQVREPLIALRQELREQSLERVEIVAERPREEPHGGADLARLGELAQGAARSDPVLGGGVLDDRSAGDAARENRQLLREPHVQRVERVDPKPLRLVREAPAARRVACERGRRELERQRL